MNHYKAVLVISVVLLTSFSLFSYFHVTKQTFQDDKMIAQHKKYIRMCIDESYHAFRESGDYPFAAILVDRNGELLHKAKNLVNSEGNLTKHAELILLTMIDQAQPEKYSGSIMYVNTEPCPMCTAAVDRMHKYVSKIVYGCSAETLAKYSKKTRNVLPSHKLLSLMGSEVEVEGPVLEKESEELHISYWGNK